MCVCERERERREREREREVVKRREGWLLENDFPFTQMKKI